ncbi:sensor histidine kinase [Micromonospora antibiotica]|uniref:histidine kinase n=1 Tax=Micromonospora antibiotica TaxID=2807623 RepID=A0ABS3V255_9ACTN|nr:sensor histidine kinase [Micromonospora antibiotica]MBO4159647.1 sensor domain-containing protein [Micromonospora antibiotica]
MSTGITRPAPSRRDRIGLRFVLLGQSLILTFASVLGLALCCLWITAVLVVGAGIGIPVALALTVLVRWLADRHREWATNRLGEPIARPYRPIPAGNWWTRLWAILRDPASWRDWLWLGINSVISAFTVGMSFLLFLGGLFYLIYPFLFWVTPPTVFRTPFGPQFELHSVRQSLVMLPLGPIFFTVWYGSAAGLANLNARVMRSLLAPTEQVQLRARVEELTSSRAETVDTQASELRRIERDLHDGAQARLASLGMSLGLAEQLLTDDPQAARRLLAEARESTTSALVELRDLVRGIHPPVLADRGLDGALQALALVNPVPTSVVIHLSGRLPAPVESAAYFAVAEALTNAIKHAEANRILITLECVEEAGGLLSILVSDDGRGGASIDAGTGLRGVARRLAAFDGTLVVDSPLGGPTEVRMTLPCELS